MEPHEGFGLPVEPFPKTFSYHGDDDDAVSTATASDMKPRILIMGLRRSGKSSIQKVVFHKMSPNETLFLEITSKIFKDDVSNTSFINFQIWDIPGQIDFLDSTFDLDMIFGGTGALIFVVDAQINPQIRFEIFIHKVDGLSDDHKIETQRDISQRANEELHEASLIDLHLSFHLTSIYDHSIFEAFSKVVQKLIPQHSTLENLLSSFVQNSGIEKTFLFDVVSKIYIATDGSPVDMQSYELCCEMIDVMLDMTCIYGDDTEDATTQDSTCIIRLNNSNILYLREVTRFLVVVCIVRDDAFTKRGIIDYNILLLKKAIHEVFDVRPRHGKQNGHLHPEMRNNLMQASLPAHA